MLHFCPYLNKIVLLTCIKTNFEPSNILTLSDIDECSKGNFTCHPNATCINTQGSYNCQCKDGYEGFGKKNCTGMKFFNLKNKTLFLSVNHKQQNIAKFNVDYRL
jgi:hypothetical protein